MLQVPLSRPLFDGFGNQNKDQPDPELKKESSSKPANPTDGDAKAPLVHVVNERLPNGWNKRATKRQTGNSFNLNTLKIVLELHYILQNMIKYKNSDYQ